MNQAPQMHQNIKSGTTQVIDIDALKRPGFFASASQTFLETVNARVNLVRYKKNTVIFLHEEEAKNFYLVKHGWVKLFKETLDGAEAVIDVINDGNIFGEQAIFNDMLYTSSAEVVDDTTLYSIPLSLLKAEIDSNIKFAHGFITNMAKVQRIHEMEIEHKSIQNVPQRIGCFILRLCKGTDKSNITINLPYDKNLLAARLGIQPETFSRGLSKLREESGIEIKGSSVLIKSVEQLSKYCCAACSSNFPCEDTRK